MEHKEVGQTQAYCRTTTMQVLRPDMPLHTSLRSVSARLLSAALEGAYVL